MNVEQGILNFEVLKNNAGLNQARQHFDIGHSLFLVRYSFFLFKQIPHPRRQHSLHHFFRLDCRFVARFGKRTVDGDH